jgi:hypothetical protein
MLNLAAFIALSLAALAGGRVAPNRRGRVRSAE